MLAENRFWHEIATQGHSRSFILQSVTGQQGVAYRHIILRGFTEVSEEVATQISKNCRRRQPHSHLMPPPRGNPANIRMQLIFPETRLRLSSLIVWVYIHSNVCSGAPQDASFLQHSAFWPFKVVQGRDFGTNRKRVCDFLLVRHCDYGAILHSFWDTAAYWLKLPIFPILSNSAPLLLFSLEFRAEVNLEETRIMALSFSEDPLIVAWVILTQCHRVTDQQTDGQICCSYSTTLCRASYADAL